MFTDFCTPVLGRVLSTTVSLWFAPPEVVAPKLREQPTGQLLKHLTLEPLLIAIH